MKHGKAVGVSFLIYYLIGRFWRRALTSDLFPTGFEPKFRGNKKWPDISEAKPIVIVLDNLTVAAT